MFQERQVQISSDKFETLSGCPSDKLLYGSLWLRIVTTLVKNLQAAPVAEWLSELRIVTILVKNLQAAPMAEWLSVDISLPHLTIRSSHHCVWCGFKSCLRVCQVFFLGVLPFSPHLLIGPSHMSWHNLERDVELNKKKKKKHVHSLNQYINF